MTLSVYSFEITCGKCCFIKTSYNFTCIEISTECCCNSENNESLPHKQACQMSLYSCKIIVTFTMGNQCFHLAYYHVFQKSMFHYIQCHAEIAEIFIL